ncbi:hypothetical protein AN391_03714 [Pseudoalteromonas sp. P1-13-1a]|uniref:hypothetical protein n=1 Tax=Pseudoalteromonas sp. P1-13-1a TaxID=1723756 RepID=UPI0006D68CF9|nr:hypothetical protein [Pseudoalteromonas sp. P1-13-1a]KPZ52383.1 hypothetical protein AN391_03714 [Pseudoalteromonas sp. P1-13-1a]
MSIGVIGRTPPPIGGVSVFFSRRINQLIESGVSVEVFDLGSRFVSIRLFLSRSKKFEVNSLNLGLVFLLFICGKLSKSVFIDHNASRHFSGFKKSILLFFLKRSAGVEIVNSDLSEFYPNGISLTLLHPFIPPTLSAKESVLSTYDDKTLLFIKRDNLVVNSAWKYIKYNNTDLYGIETSILLLETFKKLNLLLAIADWDELSMPPRVVQKINKYKDEDRLHLFTGQKELWPVFLEQPTFLRLTPTDGDSVSVREALYFGANVIASNTIKRPSGCHIYEYGKMDSLIAVMDKYS